MASIAQAPGRTPRERRLIIAQVHVSAALLLAAALLWNAGEKLDAIGRWELRLILVAAAALALVHAILPLLEWWVIPIAAAAGAATPPLIRRWRARRRSRDQNAHRPRGPTRPPCAGDDQSFSATSDAAGGSFSERQEVGDVG